MTTPQVALLLLAIGVLAGLARWRRLGESSLAQADNARARAEEALAGFVAGPALVGQDGRAALVAGSGAIAVLRRQGTRVVARRMLPPLDCQPAIEGVTIRTGAGALGDVVLLGVLEADVRELESWLVRGGGSVHRLFPANDG